ncbi:MAG: hypothetical protein ACKV2U_32360 [Bryobacteraceae bacterium]
MSAVAGKIVANVENDVVTNPTFLVEVVSPKTRDHDRGFKVEVDAELYSRTTNGSWMVANYWDMNEVIRLDSLGCSVAVAEFYHKVENF